jgi:hypothetical protein
MRVILQLLKRMSFFHSINDIIEKSYNVMNNIKLKKIEILCHGNTQYSQLENL